MGDSSGGGGEEGVRGRHRPEVIITSRGSSSDGGHHQLKKSSSDGGQNQTEFIISQRVITWKSPSAKGYQSDLIMIQRSSLVRGHHTPNGIVG